MTINANLKAQVQARINAAGNGSTLEELWNLKLIARGLDCNESNINNLIELRLNEFGASTELKSLLQGALSVRPYARNIVPKRKTFTLSETWVAPAKIVPDSLRVTGCAGAGSGAICRRSSDSTIFVMGGQRGESVVGRPTPAAPNQSFSVIVGSGGPSSTRTFGTSNIGEYDGNSGGNSSFGALVLRGGRGGRADTSPTRVQQETLSAAGPKVIAGKTLFGGGTAGSLAALAHGESGPFRHGESIIDWGSSDSSTLLRRIVGGGDAGLFGPGSDAAYHLNNGNAPAANTGAGSGAVFLIYSGGYTDTVSSAPGSAGRWEAEWLEYE